jgi:hypothetical protein
MTSAKTPSSRKRGGQKKPETLEREQQDAELRDIFSKAIKSTGDSLKELRDQVRRMGDAEAQLLKTFKSPPMPKTLVYEYLATDWDPELQGAPADVERYEAFRNAVYEDMESTEKSIAEGRANSRRAEVARINQFAKTNSLLLKQLGQRGFSERQVSARVLRDWDVLLPQNRLTGEPTTLTRRGDCLPPPKPETLRTSWLRRAKRSTP